MNGTSPRTWALWLVLTFLVSMLALGFLSRTDGASDLPAHINDYRATKGLPPLGTSPLLTNSAQAAAQLSIDTCSFRVPTRPAGAGSWTAFMVYGYNTADQVWAAQVASPGNPNLQKVLNTSYNAVGIGRATGPCNLGVIWVVELGKTSDVTAGTPRATIFHPTRTPKPTLVPPVTATPGPAACTLAFQALNLLRQQAGLPTLPCTPVLAAVTGPAAVQEPVEDEFLVLLNNYRAGLMCGNPAVPCPAPPVSLNAKLNNAAEWMSADLGINAYFSHYDECIVTQSTDCITGHASDNVPHRDPFVRMCDFGYCYNTWKAENIAGGFTSAQAVFDGWKASPGHDSAMRDPHYRAVGIARVTVPGSPYTVYWTNDFGGVVESTGGTPSPTKTPSPTPSPTRTPSPTASPSPSRTPTTTPTATPTVSPTATTSPTPTGTAAPCIGDMNGDRVVNGSDLLLFAPHWFPNYDARFDLYPDGRINGQDMLQLAPRWGVCP